MAYVYFNGQRILRIDQPNGAMHYYFSDHLGSAAVITDASGIASERYFYYPYGGMLYSTGTDPNRYKFTGKERDAESGLDMLGARYYGSSLGRFMTPDRAAKPTAVPYAISGILSRSISTATSTTTQARPATQTATAWRMPV